ncbi:MAG: helix-turn-helix domain-containing protein [Caldilineaceae bacterium]|nr:helix-turn-helix domain-containing protein [Caldilineaceae bacterium]
MDSFITVAEAVKLTGKSRRTITRLANRLEQAGSDQVMREKTARGYSWRLSQQSLQDVFGSSQPQVISAMETPPPPPVHMEFNHTLKAAREG